MGALIKGVNSDVWLTATPSIVATNEAATDSGDHITYWTSVHTAWDKRQPLVVQTSPNGSTGWVTVTDYTFAYPIGRITFNTARVVSTNNFVRVSSGYYFNLTQVDDAHTWSLSEKINTTDTTPFQATSGYKRKTTTIKSASGGFDTFRTDNRLGAELGNLTVCLLYIDKAANSRFAFYAWLTGFDPKSDAGGVIEQSCGFEVEGDVFYLTT
jgi:hypothetical protein